MVFLPRAPLTNSVRVLMTMVELANGRDTQMKFDGFDVSVEELNKIKAKHKDKALRMLLS